MWQRLRRGGAVPFHALSARRRVHRLGRCVVHSLRDFRQPALSSLHLALSYDLLVGGESFVQVINDVLVVAPICAFGGDDGRTLYITAGEGLYRVTLARPGHY